MGKRITSLLVAIMIVLVMIPVTGFAESDQVHVIISNDTYPVEDGAVWEGDLVDTWVEINSDSTMMSCIVDALGDYSQTGAESGYISEINGLSAFDGGWMSGWMGTLNDWFTSCGFDYYTVSDGTLEPGDEIHIVYTCDYGEDCGGSWGNSTKTVKNVRFSAGELDNEFDRTVHAYVLTLPNGTHSVKVIPTADNRNYQVRTSVSGKEYKRSDSVPVVDGSVILVRCGDSAWPTMNDNSGDAQDYEFTVHIENTLPVIKSGIENPASAESTLGGEYCLDLNSIFEDADGNDLTYKVSEDGGEYNDCNSTFTAVYDSECSHEFRFVADDGYGESTDVYTVSLTVSDKVPEIKINGDAVSFTAEGDGYAGEVTVCGDIDLSVSANGNVSIFACGISCKGNLETTIVPEAAETVIEVVLQTDGGTQLVYSITAKQKAGEVPLITKDLPLNGYSYVPGEEADPLAVEVADVTAGIISYRWFESCDGINYTIISDADGPSYVPGTDEEGETYYKVRVVKTLNYTEVYTESRPVKVTVKQTYSNLKSLIIHSGTQPNNTTCLVKNSTDKYSSGIVFDPDVYEYCITDQTDSLTQLRFRAAPQESGAKVELYYYNDGVKDITWESGSSKFATCLQAGKNTLKIKVTPPAGSKNAAAEYVFHINCVPTLDSLTAAAGEVQLYFDKAFAGNGMQYSLTVPDDADEITFSAAAHSDKYTVTYNGKENSTADISGTDSIKIDVSSGNGENDIVSTYNIDLVRVENLGLSFVTDPADATVSVYDQNNTRIFCNDMGIYEGMFSSFDYTYTVTENGYVAQNGTVPKSGGVLTVKLEKAPESGIVETGAYWKNFRNSDDNMAVTDTELPFDETGVTAKWYAKLGTGWNNAPSVQIIADNALVVMAGTTLYKLDLDTGETVLTGTLAAAPDWGYTPPTYAEGMIFCPLKGGIVQAFNAETLESLWIYRDNIGGQSLNPITYSQGYVYTGFWNSYTKNANYVCLSVTDEDPGKTDEAKTASWKYTSLGGFYWAGSYVAGDYVVFGSESDDGVNESSGDSYIISLDRRTGMQVSKVKLEGAGDVRSTIAHDPETGRIYFTTTNGYLFSAKVDTVTGVISELKGVNHHSKSTSTPVVYKGRVYIGTGSGISETGSSGNILVADADTLEMIFAVGMKGYPQCSLLLTTAYEEETGYIYLYSTYNMTPGGISMLKVKPDSKSADDAELVELYDAKGYEQYCISSIINGPDGTLYYKNDSGYVFAIGIPAVSSVERLITKIGNVTIDSEGAVNAARKAYDALGDEDKQKVKNYGVLTDAEDEYAAAVARVVNTEKLISAIGTVKDASEITEGKISDARTAYDALSEAERKHVNNTGMLTDAEKRYAEYKNADAVMALIDKAYENTDDETVNAARTAYDGLSSSEKKLVKNYGRLTSAENINRQINNARETEKLIDDIGTVDTGSAERIAAARKSYNGLNDYEKSLVKNISVLVEAERILSSLETGNNLPTADSDEDTADKAEGSTKTIGDTDVKVQVDGTEYNVSKESASVITSIKKISGAGKYTEDELLSAYRAYMNLTDSQKAEIVNASDLLAVTTEEGRKNHKDEKTGVCVDNVPWYVRVTTDSNVSADTVRAVADSIGSNEILNILDIKLEDLLEGSAYEMNGSVKVTVPVSGLEEYDVIQVVHYSDGKADYLEAEVTGGNCSFETEGFSVFAVVGINEGTALLEETSGTEVKTSTESSGNAETETGSLMWLWILLLCAGCAAAVIILIARKRSRSR